MCQNTLFPFSLTQKMSIALNHILLQKPRNRLGVFEPLHLFSTIDSWLILNENIQF